MGQRLKGSRPLVLRVLAALGWTAALAAALLIVDRGLLGPRVPKGWVKAVSPQQVPLPAGPVIVPPYLPQPLRWPPQRVIYRLDEPAGWWIGFSNADVGNADVGNTGVGSADVGNTGVGNTGVGNAGVGNAGVGNAGVGSADLGSAGVGNADAKASARHQLWIGTGANPAPAALGAAANCLMEKPWARCPPGWHALSARIRKQRIVHIVGTLEPSQLARILEGLRRIAD